MGLAVHGLATAHPSGVERSPSTARRATDFSLTTEFERWDDDGVRFVFGYCNQENLIAQLKGQVRALHLFKRGTSGAGKAD